MADESALAVVLHPEQSATRVHRLTPPRSGRARRHRAGLLDPHLGRRRALHRQGAAADRPGRWPHLQPYFTEPIPHLMEDPQFRGLFDLQCIGTLKPNAPVLINSNRYDPLVPWTAAVQLGWDWCDKGADVEFRTNEEPPFMNKLVINHALPMLVDGEPALQWLAARFNGEPTTPNCGQFP